MTLETDVLIIGAGPAGLAAAFEVASRGVDVIIIDESISKGGKLSQQTQFIHALPSQYKPARGFELAEELINKLDKLSVKFLLGHRVIGVYKDGSIGITDEENVFPVQAKKIIVATGAAENAVAFPKWTLPGIMTIGAAQTLINRDFVIPGKNAIIVGSSNFALETAIQLIEVGIKVEGIIEQKNKLTARDSNLIKQMEKYGVPIYFDSSVQEARGNGEVSEIDIQKLNGITTKEVDLVCLDGGRSPVLDSFYQLGCSFGYREELGGWVPQYNKLFQTNQKHIFIAGNAAGISVQGPLLITGMIAGTSVCESLMALSKDESEQIRLSLWKELEILEVGIDEGVWHGRIEHISEFEKPLLVNQYIT